MALGMPVAFSLIGCGIVMMYYMGLTDPQIVIQNMGRRQPQAAGCPLLHAGW